MNTQLVKATDIVAEQLVWYRDRWVLVTEVTESRGIVSLWTGETRIMIRPDETINVLA